LVTTTFYHNVFNIFNIPHRELEVVSSGALFITTVFTLHASEFSSFLAIVAFFLDIFAAATATTTSSTTTAPS
jgi:hypothetical protein